MKLRKKMDSALCFVMETYDMDLPPCHTGLIKFTQNQQGIELLPSPNMPCPTLLDLEFPNSLKNIYTSQSHVTIKILTLQDRMYWLISNPIR